MARVELVGTDAGLARMLAGLIEANLAADPGKERVLDGIRGTVGIHVRDTGEDVHLRLADGVVRIADGRPADPDLTLDGDADTILGLSTVRLRFGMPDVFTSTGRGAARAWVTGGFGIGGLPGAAPLLRVLVQLVNVTA